MNGYYVARKNFFMGLWVKHAGMYPDWQLRLFRRDKGRYEERIVHEHVVLEGTAGYLSNPLEHNDFKGLERWFDRHNRYTSMEAIEIRQCLGRRIVGADSREPFFAWARTNAHNQGVRVQASAWPRILGICLDVFISWRLSRRTNRVSLLRP